jgi:hypothetical protein
MTFAIRMLSRLQRCGNGSETSISSTAKATWNVGESSIPGTPLIVDPLPPGLVRRPAMRPRLLPMSIHHRPVARRRAHAIRRSQEPDELDQTQTPRSPL